MKQVGITIEFKHKNTTRKHTEFRDGHLAYIEMLRVYGFYFKDVANDLLIWIPPHQVVSVEIQEFKKGEKHD